MKTWIKIPGSCTSFWNIKHEISHLLLFAQVLFQLRFPLLVTNEALIDINILEPFQILLIDLTYACFYLLKEDDQFQFVSKFFNFCNFT